MQLITYPRLYQAQFPGDGDPITSQGDQSVSELFRQYANGAVALQNLNFGFRVMDCALRLFGDFREWSVLQRNNPDLTGYNIEFLRDTLRFITEGQREMSPLTWGDLVSERNQHSPSAHHLTLPELAVPKDITTPQVLQLWCSRHGGFEDMLQSLFVFFGEARASNA